MRRSFVFDYALLVPDHYRYILTEDAMPLHDLPVDHTTGFAVDFFPFLISGCRIESRDSNFDTCVSRSDGNRVLAEASSQRDGRVRCKQPSYSEPTHAELLR